ncbi:PhnE/PtxC family ABC transporter permease [Dethiothermospora halolimnae]|uniref:PhnE/PtxC family ABC transporter permease n=1 Tax=Dethiothermospora halolimnae TaxID=3114390 RepID=UPI003CCB90ED
MANIIKFLDYHRRGLLTLFLTLIFILSLLSVNWSDDLIHSGGKTTILQIIKAFFSPDLSLDTIKLGIVASWRTLAYATAGMSLAIIIALIIGTLASGVLTKSSTSKFFYITLFRGLLSFMRGIHELVWAWLFVAASGLSPFAAIFALAIPYGGTLGKIFADMINDVSKEPINGLRSTGASPIKVLFYGYFPMAIPNMISYTMYRFECAVRSSAIMSFVGLGGLGYQIHLSLSDLAYNEVWTFIFFLIGLVLLIDFWSNLIRKRLIQ